MTFAKEWSRDAWSHRVVRKGLTWEWSSTPPPFRPFLQQSTPQLDEFVSDLLSAGAIQRTNSLNFQGPLFSVPKKNSTKRRVILDLSTLNKSIFCPTFRMTTLQDVKSLLPVGAFTTSIDLKDAYWHVPVHRHFGKFLGFSINGKKYCFRAMPFGLNVAPRIFTKICRPIVRELRLKGINLLVYLDDWLVWGATEEECREATRVVLDTLMKRGFLVNWEKSRLEPSRIFQWLGVQWDTLSAMMSLPPDKVESVTQDLCACAAHRVPGIREGGLIPEDIP